uniref:Uncharacterized protein n=1 Tax=Meloidogyne enterolobii TaxID=390850 RepID=A0A6V7W632_MELEN|nr:unnamed protein product [Meloidogyne enterolobii]
MLNRELNFISAKIHLSCVNTIMEKNSYLCLNWYFSVISPHFPFLFHFFSFSFFSS